ncbi:MAG: type II toxin-antitoxin system HicB family antitoxin [Fretibacterium sp.]|nr:type II toxin-antitoxin system HicB family antitoxin [Fretibacterium sp.]
MNKKPDRYRYPAFLGLDETTGRYYILFPDLPGCTTTGDTEDEALACAREALSLHLFGMEDDGDEIPAPSPFMGLAGENGEAVVLIDVWMPSFRERMETKAVNRTVTLPGWLDREAKTAALNYSQILQDGIMERLNISRQVSRFLGNR